MAKHVGRHRAPGYSPLTEISQIASSGAQPVARVSAVALVSGGLVASMAGPAEAVQAPLAGSAGLASSMELAVTAPSTPIAAGAFGAITFEKKAAPVARASRTTTRTTTTSTPATPAKTTTTAAQPAAKANDGSIIGIAASLSGIPYRYGGTTTAGFDCSGFTSYVYRQAGKSIPRTAEAQRAGSTKVANPLPGDLIFFGYPAYHVGIFAGGGMMYDSPRTGSTTGLHPIWTYTNVSYGRY